MGSSEPRSYSSKNHRYHRMTCLTAFGRNTSCLVFLYIICDYSSPSTSRLPSVSFVPLCLFNDVLLCGLSLKTPRLLPCLHAGLLAWLLHPTCWSFLPTWLTCLVLPVLNSTTHLPPPLLPSSRSPQLPPYIKAIGPPGKPAYRLAAVQESAT